MARKLPPLYFVTPVWGDEYVRLFLELTLPSQLAGGNLQYLRGREDCRYVIFTRSVDAVRIRLHPAYQRLSQLLPTTLREIDELNVDGPAGLDPRYAITSNCYRIAISEAAEADAANVILTADIILSDGFVKRCCEILASGKRAIELCGPRTLKAPMENELRSRFAASSGETVTISPRTLAQLTLRHLHPAMQLHVWDGTDRPFQPSSLWFPIGPQAVLVHAFHLHPIVVHPRHLGAGFGITIDTDFVARACPDADDSYVVTDSDDLFCCELSGPGDVMVPNAHSGDLDSVVQFYVCTGGERNFRLLRHPIRIVGEDASPGAWRQAGAVAQQVISAIQMRYAQRETPVPPPREHATRFVKKALHALRKRLPLPNVWR